jgi:hypothetical protein
VAEGGAGARSGIRFGHRLGADGSAAHWAPLGAPSQGAPGIHKIAPWTPLSHGRAILSGARCIARPYTPAGNAELSRGRDGNKMSRLQNVDIAPLRESRPSAGYKQRPFRQSAKATGRLKASTDGPPQLAARPDDVRTLTRNYASNPGDRSRHVHIPALADPRPGHRPGAGCGAGSVDAPTSVPSWSPQSPYLSLWPSS